MRRRHLLSLVAVLATASQIPASIVRYRSLEQVLTPDMPVVKARVEATRREFPAGSCQVTCKLADAEVLRGPAPRGQEVVHSYSTLVERRIGDKIIRVSPIRDGSGLETELQVGETYIFLLDATAQCFIRAEPLTAEAKIREILAKQQQ